MPTFLTLNKLIIIGLLKRFHLAAIHLIERLFRGGKFLILGREKSEKIVKYFSSFNQSICISIKKYKKSSYFEYDKIKKWRD